MSCCDIFISTSHQENCLMEVLKRCKKVIGWQISDLKGISPLVCTYHIYMEEEAKPIRQFQRRLNPHLQEVVRNEVLKLLQKVNVVTVKYHFPLPFIDQVLERVFGHPFYCFLDGRMPFGLCNAPATFQRCMLSIFIDMVERIMEVFMDDITVYGGTFEEYALKRTWCSTGRNAILWYVRELSLAISFLKKALKLIKQRWSSLSNYHLQQL
ncbi:hypothetical protein AAG906_019149 [Vitis piasezkii]